MWSLGDKVSFVFSTDNKPTNPEFIYCPCPRQIALVNCVQVSIHYSLHIQHVTLHEVDKLIAHLREVWSLLGVNFCKPLRRTVFLWDLICSSAGYLREVEPWPSLLCKFMKLGWLQYNKDILFPNSLMPDPLQRKEQLKGFRLHKLNLAIKIILSTLKNFA